MTKTLLHTYMLRREHPANQPNLHVRCNVRNPFVYSEVDSTHDHLLASPEDGPGISMGMLDGSGREVPIAVASVTEMTN